MNYERAELREQLAGAYVVGTLRGAARRRFERTCATSSTLQAAVRRWEDQLMPLLRDVEPVAPRPELWPLIARRIGVPAATPRVRATAWRWAFAATLAAGLFAALTIPLLMPPLRLVAAVGADRLHPLWDISGAGRSGTLTIRALQQVQSNPRLAYELWALPGGGKAPVSLGLLPRAGSIERVLSPMQRNAMLQSARLAVSLEPPRGSPTGTPTGPILFTAELHKAG